MSLKIEKGQNISTAVHVLVETYKNLNILFTELDALSKEEGFIPLTPRFLRWKSDSSYDGWLTSNFIKLYQITNHTSIPHLPDLSDSDLYCVEVDLTGEENYPEVTLAKLTYDFTQWTRMPAVSDHWIFGDIFRMDNHFRIKEDNGKWTSEPFEKSSKKYWGLKKAVAIAVPLVDISSPETIKSKIFKEFRELE
ncbi:hypothetical protein [Mesobacillus foraminis]|uniref:hypothetical protein n=1 Tax=Mesobacillus foraminis TaxID=279826 RepID=UPI000EF54D40|nr:hypothetical protein [Mesobacillus foraminis]